MNHGGPRYESPQNPPRSPHRLSGQRARITAAAALAVLALIPLAQILSNGRSDAAEPRGKTSAREAGPNADAPRTARDPLAGVPYVACRNWAIADAAKGTIVAEHAADARVDVASTTKIMTAYVVLRHIGQNRSLWSQKATFSERAANTGGSSCGLKAGERISVCDLVHGLLLPSGNDAAVALAEHFGPEFSAAKGAATDGHSRFIAEMNREAQNLGMSATRFKNANGLPEKGHTSSARDLVRLTARAARLDLFCEVVNTRNHTARVTTGNGSARTVTWKSTNRLLAMEGYTGVKTGYTRAAGSCLVSMGERRGDRLIVVVLGAPSAGAAVADSRNLYRWAWIERGHKN